GEQAVGARDLSEVKQRLGFIESLVEAQAGQLQDLQHALTGRDQLLLELTLLLQKSLEKRWQVALRYFQTLNELKQLKEIIKLGPESAGREKTGRGKARPGGKSPAGKSPGAPRTEPAGKPDNHDQTKKRSWLDRLLS
ncbi:MAG: hypothetical protein JXR89_11680, partial [Deltaproteobacteria bacterium]|nr:hypothetical protein [Deltaproteobacteria bacterium]